MGVIGPILTWLLYKLGKKININHKLCIFVAVTMGSLLTYCTTSIQLALAYPSEYGGFAASAIKFLSVFAPTQIPLGIVEGLLTILIVLGLESFAEPELREISFLEAK